MDNTLRFGAISILMTEALLLFIPLGVLGAAINWPESLDEPASVNLPKILEEETPVKVGYFIYMVYSVLIAPLGITLSHVIGGSKNRHNVLLKIANGLAVASAILRVLGIIRWLVPMYSLARVYTDPNSSEELRQSIEVMYDMLNDYAGSVGEILGVGFFASLWVLMTSIVIIRDGGMPKWVGYFGLVAAMLLGILLLAIADVELGILLTLNVAVLHVWWLLIALILAFRPQWVSSFDDETNNDDTKFVNNDHPQITDEA